MDLMQSIVAHLSNELDVRVSTEKPANAKLPMVTVVRAGGGGSRFTDEARVTIHSWAATESAAYELGKQVITAMFSLEEFNVNVCRVTEEAFYSNIYTDGTRRWTSVHNILCNR